MDSIMFRKEMHQYIDEKYDSFLRYQQTVIDSLKEFNRICRKNNIRYYMGFGSLLGVYRDHEVLPWDYDIDVIVPITEKVKLISALKQELAERFYFYCPEVDAKCRHFCMRITQKGFDSAAIHMDVFFLIGAPTDDAKRASFRKKVRMINFDRKEKLMDHEAESLGEKKRSRIVMLKKLFLSVTRPLPWLNYQHKTLCDMVPLSEARYVCMMQAAADTYTAEVFGVPSEVMVDGELIYAPTDIVGFFNQTYKNYQGYPPISSRFDEFYFTMRRLDYFANRSKIEGKMDYQINSY